MLSTPCLQNIIVQKMSLIYSSKKHAILAQKPAKAPNCLRIPSMYCKIPNIALFYLKTASATSRHYYDDVRILFV